MKLLFLICIISVICLQVIGKSVVSTINNGTSHIKKNISNDSEMTPEECPKYMDLFPVDNDPSNNFICDCNHPAYLYYFEDDSCYQAYEQGPCPSEYYLILSPGEDLAKCEKNPCLENGLVPFQDTCAGLYKVGPPCIHSFILTVDPDNFQLRCTFKSLNIIKAPEIKCLPGSRRNALGACKKEFN
ncbi:uncharacterized protein LOC117173479 [Belonocnema kinseyi]|uniref:uncharacterized protein LOC117173479 n=1 Tax=Belonocnema kinseyi TaxID=2817044 RepID=UPI00143CE826|nr:uncharacterized protein LOC117173479 [Belonocnema kinseyi]